MKPEPKRRPPAPSKPEARLVAEDLAKVAAEYALIEQTEPAVTYVKRRTRSSVSD